MSQRTRARTTGGARKPRNASPATTPARAVPASEAAAAEESASSSVEAHGEGPGERLLAPETLARTLRAVAAELERDPALARRVAAAVATDASPTAATSAEASGGRPLAPDGTNTPEQAESSAALQLNRTFHPKLVTGTSPDLGAGIPDPFALYDKLGAGGLRAVLDELRLGTLRAIVREHDLDPQGVLARHNDAAKLRAAILKAASNARPTR